MDLKPHSSVDQAEVDRFSAIAAEWWDAAGKFKPLHLFNPVRLSFIRDEAARRFGRDITRRRPFEGLRLLDIGCGGGLLCEPMARLGFQVTGVDASERNVAVAATHAKESGLAIDYRAGAAEDLESWRALQISVPRRCTRRLEVGPSAARLKANDHREHPRQVLATR